MACFQYSYQTMLKYHSMPSRNFASLFSRIFRPPTWGRYCYQDLYNFPTCSLCFWTILIVKSSTGYRFTLALRCKSTNSVHQPQRLGYWRKCFILWLLLRNIIYPSRIILNFNKWLCSAVGTAITVTTSVFAFYVFQEESQLLFM